MVNQGLTIVVVLLVGAALILLVWGVSSVLPPASRLITKSFWCPFRKRRVTAELREEAWGGTRFEVSSCTAFAPPTAIRCRKLCLRLEELSE